MSLAPSDPLPAEVRRCCHLRLDDHWLWGREESWSLWADALSRAVLSSQKAASSPGSSVTSRVNLQCRGTNGHGALLEKSADFVGINVGPIHG